MVSTIMFISDICQLIGINCDWIDRVSNIIDLCLVVYYIYKYRTCKRGISGDIVVR